MAKQSERRDKYLVGYAIDDAAVYGRNGSDGATHYAQPLAAAKALKALAELWEGDQVPQIYRLTPVPLSEVEAEAKREAQKRKGKHNEEA